MCRVAMLLASLIGTTAVASPPTTWTEYPGYAAGYAGIVVVDLDNEGPEEAVVTGGDGGTFGRAFLAALEHLPALGFRTRRMRLLRPDEEFRGSIVSHPGTDQPRIVATVRDGLTQNRNYLVTFSGPDLVRGADVPVDAFILHGLADVDADGVLDAIGIARSSGYSEGPVQIRNLASGALVWADANRSAESVIAAQLDADAALELVYGNAGSTAVPGIIVDGSTHAVEWSWDLGFRGLPVTGNFDTDPSTREFAIVSERDETRAYLSSPNYLAQAPIQNLRARVVVAADFDGNGDDEVLVGDGSSGGLTAYRPWSWTQMFDFPNATSSLAGLAVGQLDQDPSLEVIFGDSPSSNSRSLTIFDADGLQQQFRLFNMRGPHSNVVLGDLDADGNLELAYATLDSGAPYYGGTLVVLDAETGVEQRRLPGFVESRSEEPGMRIMLANLDADVALEVIAVGGNNFGADVRAWDGATLALQWSSSPAGERLRAAAMASLNSDSIPDVIVSHEGRLRGIDGATGTILWSTASFGGDTSVHVAAGQLDADAALEAVLTLGTITYVVDTRTRLIEASYAVAAASIGMSVEGVGTECRIVHYLATRLDRHHCNGPFESSRDYAMPATTLARPLSDSDGPLLLSDGDALAVQVDDQLASAPIQGLGPSLGWSNQAAWSEHGEGVTAYVGGALAVHRLEVLDYVRIFRDGFDE